MKTNIRRSLPVVLLVAALCEFGYAQNQSRLGGVNEIGKRNINKGSINFISIEKEIALGRALAEEIERQIPLIADASINEYVARLGRRIAGNSDITVPTTFKVTTSPDFNAFSLPGGFVYINAGLILAAENEAELASVIAYQVAHIAARHTTEMQSKAELLNFSRIPLVFATSVDRYSYRQTDTLVPRQFTQFYRKDVSEADFLGAQYLYKTGYDPNAALDMLQKVPTLDAYAPQSTHPSPSARMEAVQEAIDNLPGVTQSAVTDSVEFQSAKARLAEIMKR
jgi:beta-barrel assembly-enhancing protease